MLLSVLQRGFNDPRVALAPVVPALRNQAHSIAISLHSQAIAVVLDFVKPFGTKGDLGGPGGDAKLKCAGHSGDKSLEPLTK